MFKKAKKNENKFSDVKFDEKKEWVCPTCGTVNSLTEDYCSKCMEARKRKRDIEQEKNSDVH